MRRSLISAIVLSVSLASSGAASAAEWVPKAMGSRVTGEINWWPGDFEHIVTMGIGAQIRLTQVVFADLDVAWAVFVPDRKDHLSSTTSTFAFGNPTAGVHWAGLMNDKLAMHAGGSLTVATLFRDRDVFYARPGRGNGDLDVVGTRGTATLVRAYADFHRLVPDYIFLRGRAGMELQIRPELYYRTELAPVVAIAVVADTADFILDIQHEIEARSSLGIGGGLHLQAVFTTLLRKDTTQLALEPYFVFDPGRGVYARVGTLLALDEPLGFGLESGRVASICITLGGRW